MVVFRVLITKDALKDLPNLSANGLKKKFLALVEVLKTNPFQNPPAYEKLLGDLSGYYSRRINIKRRLVYTVDEVNKIVKIVSAWSHYE